MTDHLPDDELEIDLRPAPEVGRRMLILSALLEQTAARDDARLPATERATGAFDLREWLRHEGVWSLLTPAEARLFDDRGPSPARSEHLAEGFMAEALMALAWTTGVVGELAVAAPADLAPIIPDIPHPWDSTASWLASRALRPLDEIAAQRETCELWAWRFAIEPDLTGPDAAVRADLAGIIRDTERAGQEAGLLPPGGYRINGGAISTLDAPTRDTLTESQLARLHALNWVCGFGDTWDEVPLDI